MFVKCTHYTGRNPSVSNASFLNKEITKNFFLNLITSFNSMIYFIKPAICVTEY